jgi:hypothetical protein
MAKFCLCVAFEDNEFKDNKSLNDQGIIVAAQLNLNMSWSLT